MDLTALVEQAREGDLDAFADLTRRFQHMAFGYALAHVRDFGAAQDVVQDAFVAAWFSLRRLDTPAAFPGWLRSIVGHSAQRVLRRRVLATVSLDHAASVPSAEPGPDRRTMIVLSPAVAAAGIYPAIDAVQNRSRFRDPAVVGAEHVDVATRVQATLREARRLEAVGEADRSADAGRPEDERRLLARARRLWRWFAQPFFIAEPFTKRPGTHVSRDETVRVCAGILAGAYDDVPEQAFYFKGGIDEVLASARPGG